MQNKEDKELASLQRRAFAFFIDDMIVSIIFLVIIWDFLPANGSIYEISEAINQFVFYLIMIKIFYHTYFVYKFKATLGKIALKIEVVSENRTSPTFMQSLNRAVFRVISEIVFYLGFAFAFFDGKRQTLHDKTAKTVVINA